MADTMKALLFPEPWNVQLIDVDIPDPGDNEVLARIESVGICGSDVGIYEGEHWITAHEPGGHGHETGAVAVAVGKNVTGVREGDRLARMGLGYAQYSKEVNVIGHGKDEEGGALPIVRNDLTTEQISFADAVGCAINCYERAELERIEGRRPKAVVIGLGPIGLILTQILIGSGGDVVVAEPSEIKRTVAEGYGAAAYDPFGFGRPQYGRTTYVDRILEDFGPADAVFEMAGENTTLLEAIRLVRPGFRVMVFGAQSTQVIPYVNCRKKGVELVYPEAMVNSKSGVDYWIPALDMIAGKGKVTLDLESLITRRISLEEAVHVFEHYDRREFIKIIVEPWR